MKNVPQICIQLKNDTIIKFEEKKSILYLSNPNKEKITCVQVDGCAIKNGTKCDHLYEYNQEEHFLELKGSDIKHAVEQLKRSIHELSSSAKVYAEIVSPRSSCIGNDIQLFKKEFKKMNVTFNIHKTKTTLQIKKNY